MTYDKILNTYYLSPYYDQREGIEEQPINQEADVCRFDTYFDRILITEHYEYTKLFDVLQQELTDGEEWKADLHPKERREVMVDMVATMKRSAIAGIYYHYCSTKGCYILYFEYNATNIGLSFSCDDLGKLKDLYAELLDWWLD